MPGFTADERLIAGQPSPPNGHRFARQTPLVAAHSGSWHSQSYLPASDANLPGVARVGRVPSSLALKPLGLHIGLAVDGGGAAIRQWSASCRRETDVIKAECYGPQW